MFFCAGILTTVVGPFILALSKEQVARSVGFVVRCRNSGRALVALAIF